jgi:hypothetical protein
VLAVSREWSPAEVSWDDGWDLGKGGLHDRLAAETELDLRAKASTVTFDLTDLLKTADEEGVPVNGFLLTARDADGFGILPADLARFSRLGEGTLEIRTWTGPRNARLEGSEGNARKKPAKLDEVERPGR